MRIELTICDHCERIIPGCEYESYRLHGITTDFDICPECQEKPFKALKNQSTKGRDISNFIRRLANNQPKSEPSDG